MRLVLDSTAGIDASLPCRVYVNLHLHVFSVQQRGKVVAHVRRIVLSNVVFTVSEAGRQRVLREKRKNVHAFAVGWWVAGEPTDSPLRRVRYNPYLRGEFFDAVTGESVAGSPLVLLAGQDALV